MTSRSSTRATTICPFSASLAAADDHRVAVEDAGLDHRIAGHFQRVVLAVAEQRDRHLDMGALIAQRLDRQAGGDAAIERQLHRAGVVGGAHARQVAAEVAADHVRREAGAEPVACGTVARSASMLRPAAAVTSSARAR